MMSEMDASLRQEDVKLRDEKPEGSITGTKELHVAPMMNFTTRELRALLRILTRRTILWTEMVVDDTMIHTNELDYHLGIDKILDHNPIVCQIGGNNPILAGRCTKTVEQYGYDEINLNCGCPSNKVANEREFGAALMKKPELVASMVSEMKKSVGSKSIDVSVKTRIGAVDRGGEETCDMIQFIETLQPLCSRIIMHARKVHLHGLNAKQNRTIPPLNYPYVFDLCRRFPTCDFIINGGIKGLREAKFLCYGKNDEDNLQSDNSQHSVPCSLCAEPYGSCIAALAPVDVPPNLRGCMLGRAAMENPCIFWDVDRYFYGEPTNPCQNRREVLQKYCQYLEQIYPRRCCDDDERVTFRYPAPNILTPTKMDRPVYCTICAPTYKLETDSFILPIASNDETISMRGNDIESKSNDGGMNVENDGWELPRHERFKTRYPGQKFSINLICQALKPIRALFFGLPCNKKFRRACDGVIQDKTIRNCGPGYLLRKAIESIPDEYLEMPLVKADDGGIGHNGVK